MSTKWTTTTPDPEFCVPPPEQEADSKESLAQTDPRSLDRDGEKKKTKNRAAEEKKRPK